MTRPLRVCLIASSRFPLREPFAGGLEAQTYGIARELGRRGHVVTVFAAPGSDPELGARMIEAKTFTASAAARRDVGTTPQQWMSEHHAYLGLMMDLARSGPDEFDVVHNNSLHHLPIACAEMVGVPMVTTLHTPPVAWLESAVELAPHGSRFASVSVAMARAWQHAVRSDVVLNGVDTEAWRPGPGGGPAVWTGRLVPEKAPHLALDAARAAGMPLVVAGPVLDDRYFRAEIEPRLGPRARYIGHRSHADLVRIVGAASVALVTPVWDEPYGLVAAEAMACGTPVAAFDRGALGEILTPTTGVLVPADDVSALADALPVAAALSRDEVRRHAEARLSAARMVDEYERLYLELSTGALAA